MNYNLSNSSISSSSFWYKNKSNKLRNNGYTFNDSRRNESIKGVMNMFITTIECDSISLIANRPIFVEYINEDGIVISKCNELGINSFGDNSKEAHANLIEKIGFLWVEYVECVDEELSSSAIELKNKLLKHFRKK